MADFKKVAEFSEQIAASQAAGVNTAEAVLLALLRAYAFEAEESAKPLAKLGMFVQRITQAHSYQDYAKTKILLLEQLGDKPLTEFFAEIDQEISTAEGRQAHNLTKLHDTDGHFHAMLVAFFKAYHDTFDIQRALAMGGSELYICHGEAVIKKLREAWGAAAENEAEIEEISEASAQPMKPEPKGIDYTQLLKKETAAPISEYLSPKDRMSFSSASRHTKKIMEIPRSQVIGRKQLLKAVEQQNLEKVAELAQNPSLLRDPQFERGQNPAIVAALDRNKEIWDALWTPALEANKNHPELIHLLEFHYLVISGDRVEAEKYLAKFDIDTRKYLVFTRGPLGFSAIELSEIEHSDVQMRLRFYRQLTPFAKELTKQEAEIYQDNDKYPTDEAKWDAVLNNVMMNLDDETKQQAATQLNRIKDNPQLSNQKQAFLKEFKAAYTECIDLYKQKNWNDGDDAWIAIGKLMRKLARHLLWEYFRPNCPFYNRDNPEVILRTGYEAEPATQDFRFEGGKDLFKELYSKMGNTFTVFLGWFNLPHARVLVGQSFPYVGGGLPAVSRIFEVNEQKSSKELAALQHGLEYAPRLRH